MLDLSQNKNELLRAGFEPATYGFLLCFQLQSTALPTELSKEDTTAPLLPPIGYVSSVYFIK